MNLSTLEFWAAKDKEIWETLLGMGATANDNICRVEIASGLITQHTYVVQKCVINQELSIKLLDCLEI